MRCTQSFRAFRINVKKIKDFVVKNVQLMRTVQSEQFATRPLKLVVHWFRRAMVRSVSPLQLATAEKYAVAGVAVSKGERGDILDTLAAVHFKKGEIDKAIELQEQAVAKAPDEMKDQIQATLDTYKAAKK